MALERLGLGEPGLSRLTRYLETLDLWSRRVNLTGVRAVEDRVRTLVASVLPALERIAPGTLLDVGSGNGSPGLVVALLRDDVQATLLEPRQKRWAFLREAARAASASVAVVRARHDEFTGGPVRTLTLRALALPLAALRPLVEPGGRVIVFGNDPAPHPAFSAEPDAAADIHVYRALAARATGAER